MAPSMAKCDVLTYLARVPDASAAAVGDALRLSLPAAGMALLRLTRSGLVARALDPREQCYYYSLTPQGRARLDFLQRGDH